MSSPESSNAGIQPHSLEVVHVSGHVAHVDENSTLNEGLLTRRLSSSRQMDGTVRVEAISESLFRPSPPCANAGLLQLLPHITFRGGPAFEVRRTASISSLPIPHPVAGSFLSPCSPHVAEFLYQHKQGAIHIGRTVSRSQLISEIALGFPRQSMAIMTSTYRDSCNTASKLRQFGVQCAQLTPTRSPQREHRVVVGTFSSMAHNLVEFEKRDILIVLRARGALSEQAQYPLMAPDLRGRLYTFRHDDEKYSPLEEDRLAAIFGFSRIDVPAHGSRSVDVNLQWATFSSALASGQTALQIKRQGIWRCEPRNRMIASLARRAREAHRVVVLADSLEHVARLSRRLPGWPLRFDSSCALTGLSDAFVRRLQAGQSRWVCGNELIATPSGLAGMTPGTFDLLVWAGSGLGLPPIPKEHLICPTNLVRRLTILDVKDRHHPRLRRWSRSRKHANEEQGWFERDFDVPTDFCQCAHFLDSRTERRC